MRNIILTVLLSTLTVSAQQKPGEPIVAQWEHMKKTDPALRKIRVSEGFHIEIFARDLENARVILTLDDGTVLVSRPKMNDVIALRDRDGDGRADTMRTAVASIERAHGLAMRGRTLYVAGVKKIVAAERLPDGSFGAPHEIVTDLPDGGQHPNRTIGVGPDHKLYVSIGSTCNDCTESNPEHATMLQMDPDGSNRRIYARGLRNTLGFDWHPRTSEMWGADNGSDWRGDDLPPEEINRIGDGLHYGWPLCFGKQAVDPTRPEPEGVTKEKFCKSSEAAALELPSHVAPIGFAFYEGENFPQRYREDAFSIWRGSWNREQVREPKVVRIRFTDGKAVAYEDFVTGFLDEDGKTHNGRLAGIAFAHDGAMLFSDDTNGIVYRVVHGERPPQPMTSAASETQTKPVLSRAFKVTSLATPESVVRDELQDVYFVSNINGPPAAKDGNGFISRVTPNGKIEKLKFIDGLDAPKGMAIRGDELWVSDIDRLHAFHRATGARIKTLDLSKHGAVFLNDVVIGPDELVYVTDSDIRMKNGNERVRQGDGRVYRIQEDDEIETAISGEELRSPNGIAWDGSRFLIVQMYGKDVLSWNPGARAESVMRGPGAYDGIVVLPNGAVIVSSHHDQALHVAQGGELRPLFVRNPTPADIGFDRKRNRLLVPSLEGDWLEAWTLPPMEAPGKKAARAATEISSLR